MSSNLEHAIRESLIRDPRITDPSEVAVVAVDSTAILRGTVGSLSQRSAAGRDARALQVLMWDSEVPADLVDVHVRDGWMTLVGEVTHQFESDAAYEAVARLDGVLGITNEIKVSTVLRSHDAPTHVY